MVQVPEKLLLSRQPKIHPKYYSYKCTIYIAWIEPAICRGELPAGAAIVTFGAPEAAEAAMKLDRSIIAVTAAS